MGSILGSILRGLLTWSHLDVFTEVHLEEDGGFACVVEAQHQYPVLLLSEQSSEDIPEEVSHFNLFFYL